MNIRYHKTTHENCSAIRAVHKFLSFLCNSSSPGSKFGDYMLESCLCVSSLPSGVSITTASEYVARNKEHAATIPSDRISSDFRNAVICDPVPESWMHNDIAAVFTGFESHSEEGDAPNKAVATFGLLMTSDGWKISGIADTRWKPGHEGNSAVVFEPNHDSGVTKRLEAFFHHLLVHDWDHMLADCLPGGGITKSRAGSYETIGWSTLIKKLKNAKDHIPEAADAQEKIHDIELRVVGDLAFAWAPFVIVSRGVTTATGVNIMTFLKQDNEWLVSGIQDTSRYT